MLIFLEFDFSFIGNKIIVISIIDYSQSSTVLCIQRSMYLFADGALIPVIMPRERLLLLPLVFAIVGGPTEGPLLLYSFR